MRDFMGRIASQDLRSVIYPFFMFMICLCVSDKFIEYHEVQVLQAFAVAEAPVLVPPFKKVPPIKIDSSLQEIQRCFRRQRRIQSTRARTPSHPPKCPPLDLSKPSVS